jgi:hypothetical protein
MSTKLILIFFAIAATAHAQSFNSGSTGADGALVLTSPGTILFEPRSFNPPLNPSGDNMYHFTFVYIGKDVTVKLSAKVLNGPLFWLAQGPVQIDGTIDLEGADGGRTPSVAGAGGYAGGAARKTGHGPRDTFKSNAFLVPLVGGSGGDGGETQGGGAGGGAFLIASSTSITVNGAIFANGGASADGVGGNGGAIRLVAPVIDGSTGLLSAKGGQTQGGDGRIRFETFQNLFTGSLNNTPFSKGKPFGLFLPPTPPPLVRVVSMGGAAVSKPEITVSQPVPLLVLVEAQNVPTGTVVKLQCFSEDGTDRTVSTTPLEGTVERSLANGLLTFPAGSSQCYVEAHWKQAPLQGR